jgi:hypothetical protein
MYPSGGYRPAGQMPQGPMYPMMSGNPNMNPMQMSQMAPHNMMAGPQNAHMYGPGMMPPTSQVSVL